MDHMLARLRALHHTIDRVGSHASVLCLLYPSPSSPETDLNVILTLRASKMRSHAGDVSFPGGRQDPADEHDSWRTALREAEEEIGLPRDIPLQRICCLPPYLSKNELFVTPCVAFSPTDPYKHWTPRPNEDEVDAVFTVRLSEILHPKRHDGRWMRWYGESWVLHRFELRSASDAPPPTTSSDYTSDGTFNLWGLTARILVDVARTAFDTTPAYEHVGVVGDETRIARVRSAL